MVRNNSIREQMFASITSWLSSEFSQKQWCQDQGITYHVFHYWYRKYRDEHPESTDGNSFVRLAVKPEADGRGAAITATARKLAVIIWNMIVKGEEYQQFDYQAIDEKKKTLQIKNIKKRLFKLNLTEEDVKKLFQRTSLPAN